MAKAGRPMGRMHQDDVRAKIQTSQLINRLTSYALNTGEVEISTGQLRAIEILLRKSLPDLQAISLAPADDETAAALRGLGQLAWQKPQ